MSNKDLSAILGPLAPLYTDTSVTEIMVNGPDQVFVRQPDSVWEPIESDVAFRSVEAVRQVIDDLMALGSLTVGPTNSLGEVRLHDGSRVVAALPPTAVDGPYLFIHKADQSQRDIFTWEHLLNIGTLNSEAQELLSKALDYYVNILVVGNQNSGKNFIANLLAESLPSKERLIVVGDSLELPVRHPHRLFLEPGGPANLSMDKVLETAAKMKPDWLVIGEMYGPEALRAVQLMNGGQRALTTLYAASPEDALSRLESMCLMANPGLGLEEIRRMIASAIGLITYQQNHTLPDYRIKITRIIEMAGVEHGRYVLEPLFTYDIEQGMLELTEAGRSWRERAHRRITQG